MQTFFVTWEIEIIADSAEDAARQALEIQRNRDSLATVFDVADENGNVERIDLLENA